MPRSDGSLTVFEVGTRSRTGSSEQLQSESQIVATIARPAGGVMRWNAIEHRAEGDAAEEALAPDHAPWQRRSSSVTAMTVSIKSAGECLVRSLRRSPRCDGRRWGQGLTAPARRRFARDPANARHTRLHTGRSRRTSLVPTIIT